LGLAFVAGVRGALQELLIDGGVDVGFLHKKLAEIFFDPFSP
jgi:hypothetical protein